MKNLLGWAVCGLLAYVLARKMSPDGDKRYDLMLLALCGPMALYVVAMLWMLKALQCGAD